MTKNEKQIILDTIEEHARLIGYYSVELENSETQENRRIFEDAMQEQGKILDVICQMASELAIDYKETKRQARKQGREECKVIIAKSEERKSKGA